MRVKSTTTILFAVVACLLGSPVAHPVAQRPVELTIVWHAGKLGDLLADMSREYTRHTGIGIHVDLVPWAQWHDKIAGEFAAQATGVDLVVFDSQSMSEFASQGHVLLLNPYLERSTKIKAADYDPVALRMYAEYPETSGNFYVLPLNQDAMGLVYRKDFLEDPKESAAFETAYGYALAVPRTYDQLRDIAEFFTRPGDHVYGIAMYGSRDYDAVTSAFNNGLWFFGGELWNPKARRADGAINSPASVAALEYYKKLFDYSPPGATGWYYEEVNKAIHSGMVVMGMN